MKTFNTKSRKGCVKIDIAVFCSKSKNPIEGAEAIYLAGPEVVFRGKTNKYGKISGKYKVTYYKESFYDQRQLFVRFPNYVSINERVEKIDRSGIYTIYMCENKSSVNFTHIIKMKKDKDK